MNVNDSDRAPVPVASAAAQGKPHRVPFPPAMEPDFLPPLPPRVYPAQAHSLLSRGQGAAPLFKALAASGGYLLEDGPGPDSCTVTFGRSATGNDETVVAMIDTITHMRREDLSPFALEQVVSDDAVVHIGAFVLPRTLRTSVGLLVGKNLDLQLGRDREAWIKASRSTEPLPFSREVLNVNGALSTVVSLPDALPQPFLEDDLPEGRPGTLHSGQLVSDILGINIDVWCYAPNTCYGQVRNLLIATDADKLVKGASILGGLDRAHEARAFAPTLLLGFASSNPQLRSDLLGMNPSLGEFINSELLPWATSLSIPVPDRSRRVISGASLGGLAAADIVRTHPYLVSKAIVQSGSFWWPMDEDGQTGDEELRLWEAVDVDSTPAVSFFHEVGTLEGHLLGCNQKFRDIVRRHGIEIRYREYTGGHGYACWRGGLFDGLVHFFGE